MASEIVLSESDIEEILQGGSSQDDSVFSQGSCVVVEAGDQKDSKQVLRRLPRNRLRGTEAKRTSVVSIDSSVKRTILILGKNGEGKSTIGNKILGSSHFKISSTDLPQTCTGSSTVESVTQLQNYVLKVYDHDGLFNTDIDISAALSSLFSEDDKLSVDLILLVVKRGHNFDSIQQQTLDTIMREWDISDISALVITHCERLSEKERERVVHQFKEVHPTVTKSMKVGVYAVGFPDSHYVMRDKVLLKSIEKDAAIIRQLIYSSEREVRINRPTQQRWKQEPQREPGFRSSSLSISNRSASVKAKSPITDSNGSGGSITTSPLPTPKTSNRISSLVERFEKSPSTKQDTTTRVHKHSPGRVQPNDVHPEKGNNKESTGGSMKENEDQSGIGNTGSFTSREGGHGNFPDGEKPFLPPDPDQIESKSSKKKLPLTSFSIASPKSLHAPLSPKPVATVPPGPGQSLSLSRPSKQATEQQRNPKSSPNTAKSFPTLPQPKPLAGSRNTDSSKAKKVFLQSPRTGRKFHKSKCVQDIKKLFEDSLEGGDTRSSTAQPRTTSITRQEKLLSFSKSAKQAFIHSAATEHASQPSKGKRSRPIASDSVVEVANSEHKYTSDFDWLKVEHHLLSLLEQKESSGSDIDVKVTVYDTAEEKWDIIAERLGLDSGKFKQSHPNNHERVRKVFREWFDNANQLPNSDKYPLKWSGLIRLLKDSGLGQLAEDLRRALTARTCTLGKSPSRTNRYWH